MVQGSCLQISPCDERCYAGDVAISSSHQETLQTSMMPQIDHGRVAAAPERL